MNEVSQPAHHSSETVSRHGPLKSHWGGPQRQKLINLHDVSNVYCLWAYTYIIYIIAGPSCTSTHLNLLSGNGILPNKCTFYFPIRGTKISMTTVVSVTHKSMQHPPSVIETKSQNMFGCKDLATRKHDFQFITQPKYLFVSTFLNLSTTLD